jgi:hypothetical protein
METVIKLFFLVVFVISLVALITFKKSKIESVAMAWHEHNTFRIWTGTRFSDTPEGRERARQELEDHLRKCNSNGDSGVCKGDSPF